MFLFRVFRHGYDGYQVLEKIINVNGQRQSIIQRAYNAAGELVHYHRKYP